MEVLGKIGQETGPKAEKDKTERVTGLGSRTREVNVYNVMAVEQERSMYTM